jgi:ankyrin repeat protein
MVAAARGHTAAVEWLLGRGADWRLTDRRGKTASDRAKEAGKAEVAATLEAWIVEHS